MVLLVLLFLHLINMRTTIKRFYNLYIMDQQYTNKIPPCEKHPSTIVISGGGIGGFSLYGAIRETNRRGIWNHDYIKKIYAVSAGASIALCIALRFDWTTLDEYMIHRPWGNSFRWYNLNFMRTFYDMGVFDKTPIIQFFTPLFAANDIPLDITMAQLYERTGVELHIYCVELFHFQYVDMSHITHPDLKVLDAVYRSSTIPFVFKPDTHIDDNGKKHIYIDGFFLGNFPSHIALDDSDIESNANKILGFRFNMGKRSANANNIVEFFQNLIVSIISHLNKHCFNLPRQVTLSYDNISFQKIYNTMFSSVQRSQLIQIGENFGRDFCLEDGGGGEDGRGENFV